MGRLMGKDKRDLLQCGHGHEAVENLHGYANLERHFQASMRPRP